MKGLMMDMPLLIPSLIQHAARCHGDVEIASLTVEGPMHRYGWGDCYGRLKGKAATLSSESRCLTKCNPYPRNAIDCSRGGRNRVMAPLWRLSKYT